MLLESSEDSSLLHQPPERDSIREDLPKKMDIFNGICHEEGVSGAINVFSIFGVKTIYNHSPAAI